MINISLNNSDLKRETTFLMICSPEQKKKKKQYGKLLYSIFMKIFRK